MLVRNLTRSARALVFFNAPTEQPGSPAPAAADPAKATVGEQLRAAIASKVSLQRDNDALKAENGEHGATISRLTTENTALAAERDQLKADNTALAADKTRLEGEIATLKASAKSAEDRAAEIVAAAGIKAEELPAEQPAGTAAGDTEGKIKDLQAKMADASPAEKFKLSDQIAKLRRGA